MATKKAAGLARGYGHFIYGIVQKPGLLNGGGGIIMNAVGIPEKTHAHRRPVGGFAEALCIQACPAVYKKKGGLPALSGVDARGG